MTEATRPWYKKLWDGWMKIAKVIGNFNARLILSLFYFVIMIPLGLIFKTSKDSLGIKQKPSSTWQPKVGPPQTLDEGRRQF